MSFFINVSDTSRATAENKDYAGMQEFSFIMNNSNDNIDNIDNIVVNDVGKYQRTETFNLIVENDETDEETRIIYFHFFKKDDEVQETIVKSDFWELARMVNDTLIQNECLRCMTNCSRNLHNGILCLQNCEVFDNDPNGNLILSDKVQDYLKILGKQVSDLTAECSAITAECSEICSISGGKNNKTKKTKKTKKNKKTKKTKKNKKTKKKIILKCI